MIFLVLFILIPIIEIALFIEVGGEIGVGWTLLLCVLTAIIGAFLIRLQGLSTLMNARNRMQRQEFPIREMFDGVCLAAAGAMLMTPGFFTDTIGFLLLAPPVRKRLLAYITEHYNVAAFGADAGSPYGEQNTRRREGSLDGNVIDAEYERLDDEDKP